MCEATIRLSFIKRIQKDLSDFQFQISNYLIVDLENNLNFHFLNETDELDNKSINFIYNISESITKTLSEKYINVNKNIKIVGIFEKLIIIIRTALYCGINMPQYNIQNYQLLRTIDNIEEIYEKDIHNALLVEMCYINFIVVKIQRQWRKVVASPYHSIGIRRIHRDFESLTI